MKTLADDFTSICSGWEKISGELLDMAELSGCSELIYDAEKLVKLSSVINVYSDILRYAYEKYDETEKKFISLAEV